MLYRKSVSWTQTLAASWTLGIAACGGNAPVVERPVAQTQPPPPIQTSAPATIPELAEKCQTIHDDQRVPIGCKMDRISGAFRLVLAFESRQAFQTYVQTVATHLAGPFCTAAPRAGRPGIVQVVVASRETSVFDCELEQWSEWRALDRPEPSQQTQQSADPVEVAVRYCKALQSSDELPIGCVSQYSDGIATITLSFRTPTDAQGVLEPILANLVRPFCAGVQQHGADALVQFLYVNSKLGQVFNCQTNRMGETFRVSDNSPRRSATTPAGSTTL